MCCFFVLSGLVGLGVGLFFLGVFCGVLGWFGVILYVVVVVDCILVVWLFVCCRCCLGVVVRCWLVWFGFGLVRVCI